MASEMSVSLASRLMTPSKVASPGVTHVVANASPTAEVVQQEMVNAANSQPAKLKEVEQKQQTLSKEELSEAAKQLNELTQSIRRELQFALDENSGRTVISVMDLESGEIIRQIPPEEIVTLISHFKEYRAGLFQEQT